MSVLEQIFDILSDGYFHSGQKISNQLAISRSSVWNAIERLKSMGLEIYAVKGQGYRLAHAIEPLNKEKILKAVDSRQLFRIPHLDLHWSIASTNQYLLDLAKYGAKSGHACVAEYQTAGRGRRGKTWISPFGGNIFLSQLWRFSTGPAALGGLSLAVAVALGNALERFGIREFSLKWPNDIVVQEKKLAGILVEISGEAAGPTAVIVGIGLNVKLNSNDAKQIDQPWTDINTLHPGEISRNQMVGTLLSELMKMFTKFESGGLSPFLEKWRQWDTCLGKKVILHFHDRQIEGTARGIDDRGALQLEVNGTVHTYHAGEVSLRSIRS